MKKGILILLVFAVLVGILSGVFLKRNPSFSQSQTGQTVLQSENEAPQTTVIAEQLDTPWSLAFLPDTGILVTERPGRVRLIDGKGMLRSEPVVTIPTVKEIGEGGLLGIALHPQFSTNQYVYLYYTYGGEGDNTLNRVVRMTYQDARLTDERIMVDTIPGSSNHNGGRIQFGPDGYLYITTGDAGNPSQAQDIHALGGKILRVTDDGKPAPGNPFNSLIYSYGHRNPQGLAWDNSGNLWSTEHGRSGILSGFDELNLIKNGGNYGWPTIQGDEVRAGMETPKLHSGSSATWAPAGVGYRNGSLFFGGLRGQALYEAILNNGMISLKEHVKGQFGRIRDVVVGPDDFLYITTSNRDGRGNPDASDDRIIRITPEKL